ncbi:MAG: histidine phosphatase family protein [Aerococcus sp.]|nr:histidine phosphatase family protein [Aerococcus sp.]
MQAIHYYFIRHGETTGSRDGIIEGWQDTPLTRQGQAQMKALSETFQSIPLALAYSSDLKRAVDSADLLLMNQPTPITAEPMSDFREYHYGSLEGANEADTFHPAIEERISQMIEQGIPSSELLPQLIHQLAPIDPEGKTERFVDFWNRIENGMLTIHDDALEYRLDQQVSEINVAIVTHQIPIRAFLHEVLAHFDLTSPLDCGHYAKVTYAHGQYTLEGWNLQ